MYSLFLIWLGLCGLVGRVMSGVLFGVVGGKMFGVLVMVFNLFGWWESG